MGCGGSKDEVIVEPKHPPPTKDVARPMAEKTQQNYHTDIANEKPAFITGLIHSSTHIRELHEKYDTSHATELGKGACGSVHAVKNRTTGDMFAMKTVSLDSMDANNFDELRTEIEVQKKLDHPNIVKIIESFEDHKHGQMYVMMEMCAGGSLVSRMRRHRYGYDERAAATIIEKMLSAVTYCHHHGVVHRDIKLDNIMYENDAENSELKLIDFGFAAEVKRGAEGMWDQLGV